ncbi:MAG: PQQ-binding-like beta-propeller repeat protein [Pseudomonadota bacterium]|nr:PQQ-binding-like beta-propeller repeat protein [Pseudomonadota bacterium]
MIKAKRPAGIGCMLVCLLALSACGDWFHDLGKPSLPGKRVSVIRTGGNLLPDKRIQNLNVIIPKPKVNFNWPQAGGYPDHAMHHLAAGGSLDRKWSSRIGDGSDDGAQLLSQPVVANQMIYTLDINAVVSAFSIATGKRLWEFELSKDEGHEGILGGGLAIDGGRIYVTTGFADVIALNSTTGAEIWRKRLDGPIRAAPTVAGGRVFVVTIANELFVLNVADGTELWTHSGLREIAGLVGAAPPAVARGIVVVPFSSGDVVALRVENGRQVWTESLVALRRSNAVSAIAHIRGKPVIDGGIVFIVGNSNRTVAVDLRTGTRLWELPIGGHHGVWVAGAFIYVVTRNAELVCVTRKGGLVRWVTRLPQFEDARNREDPIIWSGPVLAGDRLLVASTEEEIWSVSPYSGKVLGRIKIEGPVLIPPVVAAETVYVLTDEAELIAFR